MKKQLIFISTVLVLFMSPSHAKTNDDESIKTLLFPKFEKGYVVLKNNHAKLTAQLNYDLVDETMLYLESDSSIVMLDASAVVSVVIGQRSFVPGDKMAFYERIVTGNNEFFICHKTRLLSKGKATGYGSYSQTASVSGLIIPTNAGFSYYFSPDEKIEGLSESSLYLNNGKKYERINSLKTLLKHFKSHQPEIENFSKNNKTDFNKINQVIAIVEYAFSL